MPQEDSGMDDALYADEPSKDDSAEEKSEPTDSVDEEAAENPTALLPLSALGGKAKEGDSITMKIVKLHGDEAEIEITSSSEDEPETKTDEDELRELDEMEA